MRTLLLKSSLATCFSLLALQAALAAPVLKPQVDIATEVVTVGDMFTDAGTLAEQSLFLAPAPGTSGLVSIADVRVAAAKAGITDFDDQGATAVRVSRLATVVDDKLLTKLISDDLTARGILTEGMTANALFDTALDGLSAAAIAQPVQLVNLRYTPESSTFTARFILAGRQAPLDVAGRLDLMIEAPQLVATLGAGTILTPDDLQLRPIPLKFAENSSIATMGQLVGKQLQRQSRAGMVLRVADVADPQLVARNDIVTVYLHSGPLTLTIKGTALNAASLGQPVAVMNSASKRIVHGVARADGAVEITTAPLSVAGL
jgi:flagella basal body P-ring formation protein FlgA